MAKDRQLVREKLSSQFTEITWISWVTQWTSETCCISWSSSSPSNFGGFPFYLLFFMFEQEQRGLLMRDRIFAMKIIVPPKRYIYCVWGCLMPTCELPTCWEGEEEDEWLVMASIYSILSATKQIKIGEDEKETCAPGSWQTNEMYLMFEQDGAHWDSKPTILINSNEQVMSGNGQATWPNLIELNGISGN